MKHMCLLVFSLLSLKTLGQDFTLQQTIDYAKKQKCDLAYFYYNEKAKRVTPQIFCVTNTVTDRSAYGQNVCEILTIDMHSGAESFYNSSRNNRERYFIDGDCKNIKVLDKLFQKPTRKAFAMSPFKMLKMYKDGTTIKLATDKFKYRKRFYTRMNAKEIITTKKVDSIGSLVVKRENTNLFCKKRSDRDGFACSNGPGNKSFVKGEVYQVLSGFKTLLNPAHNVKKSQIYKVYDNKTDRNYFIYGEKDTVSFTKHKGK